jgi:proline dehydrogenase
MFQTNVGEADRVIRLALAATIIVFSLVAGHPVFALFAMIPMGTAFGGVCPFYSMLGLHTNGQSHAR